MFGVQKVVIFQESHTIWQKSMFVYALFILSVSVRNLSMDLIGEVKCMTWIATGLS